MFWLARPPYWRWLAAAVVIAGAAYIDLTGPPGEPYPFVAATADTGEPVVVEWVTVPRGLLPRPGEVSGVARQRLEAGTPLVDGLLGPASAVPPDWWAVQVELPPTAVVGGEVLVATQSDLEVVGVVVTPPAAGSFGAVSPGLVAFPADQAALIANALAERRATVLVRP